MIPYETNRATEENTFASQPSPRNFLSPDSLIGPGILHSLLAQETSALVIFHGPKLIVKHINERASKLLQISREYSTQKNLENVSVQLWNHIQKPAAEIFSDGKPQFLKSVKYVTQDEKQETEYFNIELRPILDIHAVVAGIIAIFSEVSDQENLSIQFKKKELQLRRQLSLIINAMPISIAYFDEHCNLNFINNMFESWFGKENKFLQGKHFSEIFGEKVHALLQPFLEETFKGVLSEFKTEMLINKASHSVEGHFLPHFSGDRNVIGFYAILFDTSERKKITTSPAVKDLSENMSMLTASVKEMSSTLEQIRSRLDVAKAKIKRVGEKNDKIGEILKKWTSDLKLSETLTARVKKSIEDWLSKRAA